MQKSTIKMTATLIHCWSRDVINPRETTKVEIIIITIINQIQMIKLLPEKASFYIGCLGTRDFDPLLDCLTVKIWRIGFHTFKIKLIY